MTSDKKQSKIVYILDSTSFYSGIPHVNSNLCYTTPQVISEIEHVVPIGVIISSLIKKKELIVMEPTMHWINYVKKAAGKIGDAHKLSSTDFNILALALQLKQEGVKPVVVSDDYSVQNMTQFIGIEFSSVLRSGISKKIEWLVFCRGCGKSFKNPKTTICDICGTELKRKVKIKKGI